MRRRIVPLALIVASALAVGCNDSSLVTGKGGSSPDSPGTPTPTDPGLQGGHFDLDTSSQYYAFGQGTTDHHVHRYDDIYDVTAVDFFNMLDPAFTQIASRVAPTQAFYIVVANAQLSPDARLEINGVPWDVAAWQQKVIAFREGTGTLDSFTLAGANPLGSLRMVMDANAILTGGLVPTQTGCVRQNKVGAHGEWRDGALTVQLLDASQAVIDPVTNAAAANGGLLWESTIFWHEQGAPCL